MENWLKERIAELGRRGRPANKRSTSLNVLLRLFFHARTTDPAEKATLKEKFLFKLKLLDEKTRAGETVLAKEELLSAQDWEDS